MTPAKKCILGMLGLGVLVALTGCGNKTGVSHTHFDAEPKSAVNATNVKSELSNSVVQGGNKLMSEDYFNIDYKYDAVNPKLEAFTLGHYLIQYDKDDLKNQYKSLNDFHEYDADGPKGGVYTQMTVHNLTFTCKGTHGISVPLRYVKYKLVNVRASHKNHDKQFVFRPVAIKWSHDMFTKKLTKGESNDYHLTLTRIHRFSTSDTVKNHAPHKHLHAHEHKNGVLPE